MSKYVIEYEDTPSSREDGVNYYKCKNVPYFSSSKTFIDRMTPYEKDAVFKDGMAQMYEYVRTFSLMRPDNRLAWFGEANDILIFTGTSCTEFAEKIKDYKHWSSIPRLGDVVEYHGQRYLVVKIDDKSYHLLSGRSFEVVCVGKDYEKEIIRMDDRKDLDLVAKAVKGET